MLQANLPLTELSPCPVKTESAVDRTELEACLAGVFSEILKCGPVAATDSFFDLGGRSRDTIALLASIQSRFGVVIALSALIGSPTVKGLASIISSGQPHADESLVPFRRAGTQLPLFCVPGIGGSAIAFRELAAALGQDQPFYGLQASASANYVHLEDTAAYYLKQIREVQPAGPYHIAGWSSGAIVALEIAQQLQAAGDKPGLLALLDCPAPVSIFQLRGFATCAKVHLNRWRQISLSEKLSYLPELLFANASTAAIRIKFRFDKLVRRTPKELVNSFEAQRVAEEHYRAQSYQGSAVLFRTADLAAEHAGDPTLGWADLIAGDLEVCDIPGDHFTFMSEPHVASLAKQLRAHLIGLLSMALVYGSVELWRAVPA